LFGALFAVRVNFTRTGRCCADSDRERVTEANLRETPRRYIPILDQFIKSEISYGIYRMKYEERTIGFSLTEKTVNDLKEARDELGKL
jgi:hypothetical protein